MTEQSSANNSLGRFAGVDEQQVRKFQSNQWRIEALAQADVDRLAREPRTAVICWLTVGHPCAASSALISAKPEGGIPSVQGLGTLLDLLQPAARVWQTAKLLFLSGFVAR